MEHGAAEVREAKEERRQVALLGGWLCCSLLQVDLLLCVRSCVICVLVFFVAGDGRLL